MNPMQGVVKYARGVGNVSLRDVEEPAPGPGQVKIAVKAAGICGTDIHICDEEYASNPPVILGHEMAGQVVAVAADVTNVSVGDRVTALPFAVTCGTCRYCRQGAFPLCPERKSFGSGVNGAFAPFLVIPASIVRKLPDNVDYEVGAVSEPVACCCKAALEKTTISLGDVVLVPGPGPIGLIAAQIAKGQGARVILVGTKEDASRLELGLELGADRALASGVDDVEGVVREMTGGQGVDIVLECAGVPAATRMGLHLIRKGGQFTQMGLHGKPFELDFSQIVYKDLHIAGSFASSSSSWDRALLLLRDGLVQVRPLIGQALPLSEWEHGFRMVRNKESLKVLLCPEQ
jgi:L-iditol 2-dehydrogenase